MSLIMPLAQKGIGGVLCLRATGSAVGSGDPAHKVIPLRRKWTTLWLCLPPTLCLALWVYGQTLPPPLCRKTQSHASQDSTVKAGFQGEMPLCVPWTWNHSTQNAASCSGSKGRAGFHGCFFFVLFVWVFPLYTFLVKKNMPVFFLYFNDRLL